ncbi:hypothetical protein [Lentzea sp. CA-135723]|uniref:hypothetical protein n=1 Tax=Lentzea sp. CA-135723 TaxID=3239950 RepID=UPI003D93B27F
MAIQLWSETAAMETAGPYYRALGALSMGQAAMGAGAYDTAAHAFSIAAELVPRVAGLQFATRLRRENLQNLSGAGSDAAAAMLAAGRPERSVEVLEQCRSVLWQQLLNLRAELPDIGAETNDLATRIEAVRVLLDGPGWQSDVEVAQLLRSRVAELTRRGRSKRVSADLLVDVGHFERALTEIAEAVQIYEELNEVSVDSYLRELADTLYRQAWLSLGSGGQRDAATSARKAVAAFRRLEQLNSNESTMPLASALHVYALAADPEDGWSALRQREPRSSCTSVRQGLTAPSTAWLLRRWLCQVTCWRSVVEPPWAGGSGM